MCGLAGHYSTKQKIFAHATILAQLAHCSPDAQTHWGNEGIDLYHNRLSIIDTDERANQPFHDHSGLYVLVFKGRFAIFSSWRQAWATPARHKAIRKYWTYQKVCSLSLFTTNKNKICYSHAIASGRNQCMSTKLNTAWVLQVKCACWCACIPISIGFLPNETAIGCSGKPFREEHSSGWPFLNSFFFQTLWKKLRRSEQSSPSIARSQ